jgi:hypothetical protein
MSPRRRSPLRRLFPAAAALVTALALSGCYYPPYGPYGGYGYSGYSYAPVPVVVGGGYYGPRYHGWR